MAQNSFLRSGPSTRWTSWCVRRYFRWSAREASSSLSPSFCVSTNESRVGGITRENDVAPVGTRPLSSSSTFRLVSPHFAVSPASFHGTSNPRLPALARVSSFATSSNAQTELSYFEETYSEEERKTILEILNT